MPPPPPAGSLITANIPQFQFSTETFPGLVDANANASDLSHSEPEPEDSHIPIPTDFGFNPTPTHTPYPEPEVEPEGEDTHHHGHGVHDSGTHVYDEHNHEGHGHDNTLSGRTCKLCDTLKYLRFISNIQIFKNLFVQTTILDDLVVETVSVSLSQAILMTLDHTTSPNQKTHLTRLNLSLV